jgi:excisionase family DNA binding protein
MSPQRSLLTMTEVTDWLGISDQTVRRAMANGLPSRLLGSRRRFDAADIEAWWKLDQPARPLPKMQSADSRELPQGFLRSTGRAAA